MANLIDSGWRKSSLSFSNSNCVEVRTDDGAVEVRNSKDPGGAVLRFDPEHWLAFVEFVRSLRRARE